MTKQTNRLLRTALALTGVVWALAAQPVRAEDAPAAPAAPAAEAAPAGPTVSAHVLQIDKNRAKTMVNKWCSACHGYYGKSISPIFPVLAAQTPDYIVTELKYFHNLTQDDRSVTHESMVEQWFTNITAVRSSERYEDAPRNEPRAWDFMRGVARDLDDTTMGLLAEYYAKLPAIKGRAADRGNAGHGKSLYLEGDAARGLLPCQMCHGTDAHGQGPIPRLAGQHADYVKLQLKYIQSGIRSVDQMQAIIANLTDADFEDVAAYVQSLD